MSLINRIFGKRSSSASVARERLQIILAHERNGRDNKPDYLPALQRELIAVISKYTAVKQEDISVQLESKDDMDVLAVNIVLSETTIQDKS